jgi:membrane protein YdbS with pleckstrin-like domain
MTDPSVAPPESPVPAATDEVPWQPLPRAARGIAVFVGALVGMLPCLPIWGALVVRLVDGWGMRIGLGLLLLAAGAAFGAWMGVRRWASTAWRLDARGLQVRRGRLFQREVLVPRSRVQHLDLERGPIERRHGLATIVVHTAGSRLQALRQSGLAEADAVALRDALVPDADVDDDAV